MSREKFTAGKVARYECVDGKSQTIYWDAVTTNLGLRVTKSGNKSYIFESSLKGKSIRMTIGSPSEWTIDAARTEATELKIQINKGIDPRQTKKSLISSQAALKQEEKTQKQRDSLLVSEAWTVYMKHHERRWGERHMKDHVNLSQAGGVTKKRGTGLTVQGVLYPLLKMRMVDINSAALKSWQVKEAETRANNARQGFEMFRAFWRWCAEHDDYKQVIDASAAESKDLRAEVPKRQSKKFDVLEKSQVKAWFGSVRELSNPVISAYLQALLITGARREELAPLKWEDVDFRWSSLWVKDKVHAEGEKFH